MRKLLFAVLAVAVMAMPAAASVQNIKVSGDIESTLLVRDQFDLGVDTSSTTRNVDQFYQNLMITQTRLRVDADLTDNVAATVGLINERAWDAETSATTDIDLNLAYVTLREMLYSPLTVTIGRQNFAYGNSFIIDSAGTNNTVSAGGLNGVAEDLTKRTALDAVRMVLDYNPLTIDVVAAKVDANTVLGAGHSHDDDVDLFGINANWNIGDELSTTVESYFWAKIDQSLKETGDGYKADTVYTPGVRASANLLDGLNVSGELAWQFGTKVQSTVSQVRRANLDRKAAAAQIIANYQLPFEKTKDLSPVLTTAYTYVSGDSGPSDGKNHIDGKDEYYTAWDPMFENQSGGTIYNTLLNLTNCHVLGLTGQISPLEDVTASLAWTGLWLDKELKDISDPDKGTSTILGLVQPDGSSLTAGTPLMTSDKKLGDEIDLSLMYDYTEDVRLKASAGWFIPGSAFDSRNDQVASQYMVSANVNF